ncbi:MAG: DUF4097 family beta strand repeat-containing protein [Candidatus Limnocylindria bacterium]
MANFVRTQSIEHEVGASGSVLVKVTDADVRVRAAGGSLARVRATFSLSASSDAEADRVMDEVQLQVSRTTGRLAVEERTRHPGSRLGTVSRLFYGAGSVELDVDLEVPAECELHVETVSGDVTADGFAGVQSYVTISGDLLLTPASGTLAVNTVSGDTTIRADAALDLDSRSVSGDLSVVTQRFSKLRAASVSGDLEVEGALDAAGPHRLETVSGDVAIGLVGGATVDVRGLSTEIHSSLPHRLEGRADRRRVTVGDGAARISFSSMSGDLLLRAPRRLPSAPTAPAADGEVASDALRDLDVLQALERGEIDVDEAARRLGGADRGR